jgi:hypothetical protein
MQLNKDEASQQFPYAFKTADYDKIRELVNVDSRLLHTPLDLNIQNPEVIMYYCSSSNVTPMYYAVAQGQLGMVQLLAELLHAHEFNPNRVSSGSDTAYFDTTLLHIQAIHNRPGILPFLLTIPGVRVNAMDRHGHSPLLTYCLDRQDNSYVDESDTGFLWTMRRAGADASIEDIETGRLPLHYSVGHSERAVDMMIKWFPGGINVQDTQSGATPLFLAAMYNKHQSMGALIANDADVNLPDKDGDGPLHVAAGNAHMHMVEMLLSAGANPFLLNNREKNPLTLCLYPVCTKLLELVQHKVLESMRMQDLVTRRYTMMSGLHKHARNDSVFKNINPDVIRHLIEQAGHGITPEYTPTQLHAMSEGIRNHVISAMDSITESGELKAIQRSAFVL